MSKLQAIQNSRAWAVIKNYLIMTVGAVIYGVAIAVFLDPNQLAPGGVSGLSIILNTLVPIGTGVWIILINIPLMIAALIVFKFRFLIGTLYATVLSSAIIEVIDRGFSHLIPDMSDHMLIAALMGGAGLAIGIGLVFRGGGSTGGFDIVVKLLRRKFRHMKTGGLYLLLDCSIIILSAVVFRNILVAMYAVVTVIINSTLLDIVLYGKDNAKMVYIISDHPETVATRLMQEVETGVTVLYGEGAYTKKDKKVLMCVVRNQQYPMVRDIVKEEDKSAFLIVTKATEIFGEGYKSQDAEEL
ncbi:MAG: YitT family protein [Clostridia bacterium]|nr:YitT family protein [Clostridia bacterium]MBR5615415.1 YitT family protein [Clostridia bacterium]MBR5881421.1 YitT family protein [Clostridia bacterium]